MSDSKLDKCVDAVLEDFKKSRTMQRYEFHDMCTEHGCDAGEVKLILEAEHHLEIQYMKDGRKSLGDVFKLGKVE